MTPALIAVFVLGVACGLRAGRGWTLRRLSQAERHKRHQQLRENSHRPPGL